MVGAFTSSPEAHSCNGLANSARAPWPIPPRRLQGEGRAPVADTLGSVLTLAESPTW